MTITPKIWSQFVLFFLGLILLFGLIWLLIVARPLINALLIAGLSAYLLDPAVRHIQQHFHIQRPGASAFTYLLTLLILLTLIITLGATVWRQVGLWDKELQAALVEMERWLAQPKLLLGFQFNLQPLITAIEESARNSLASLPLGSGTILASVTDNLLWSLVILVSLYYFLKDGPKIKPWVVSLIPHVHQPEAEKFVDQLDEIWGVFLRMQLLIFLILGLLIGVSSLLIIWSYRLGWLPLSPLGLALLLIAVYTAIQQVDNLWLRPRLLGRTLHLHPGVVMVSLIAALALSGVLAAIVIVPVIATLKISAYYIHSKLLGLSPWPEDENSSRLTVEISNEPPPTS